MIRAVLDANVLISGAVATARSSSTLGRLMAALQGKEFRLVLSDAVLTEVRRNLPKLLTRLLIEGYIEQEFEAYLLDSAEIVSITNVELGIASHPEDDLILATAVSGKAEFLVTGDKQLLALKQYRGVTIVTPRQFLDVLSV